MSMTVQLPPALRERLADVASRVRLLRGLRAVSVLVLALVLTAAAAIFVDWYLGGRLPFVVRGVNLGVWSLLGLILAWAGWRSFSRRVDLADVAAAVEEQHPELGERLTSSVELCESNGVGSGSPELIDLLVRETESRAHPLDFGAVISGLSTLVLAGLTAGAILVCLIPAAIAPRETGRFAKRFLLPFLTPFDLPDYTVSVPTGDAYVGRGRTIEVVADVTPRTSASPGRRPRRSSSPTPTAT